tara:strand:+ start:899 stop:1237 length:339 start_codon:yes stop_codon:yes gene_type:complete
MIWPPFKAWTSKFKIKGEKHFVAINYGGELLDRWVILISVVDTNLAIKVSWKQLCDQEMWVCGWVENSTSHLSEFSDMEIYLKFTNSIYPSLDSGLSIPISTKNIRPWFAGT